MVRLRVRLLPLAVVPLALSATSGCAHDKKLYEESRESTASGIPAASAAHPTLSSSHSASVANEAGVIPSLANQLGLSDVIVAATLARRGEAYEIDNGSGGTTELSPVTLKDIEVLDAAPDTDVLPERSLLEAFEQLEQPLADVSVGSDVIVGLQYLGSTYGDAAQPWRVAFAATGYGPDLVLLGRAATLYNRTLDLVATAFGADQQETLLLWAAQQREHDRRGQSGELVHLYQSLRDSGELDVVREEISWVDQPPSTRSLRPGVLPESQLRRYEAIGLDIRVTSQESTGVVTFKSQAGISHAFDLSSVRSHTALALRLPGEPLQVSFAETEGGEEIPLGTVSGEPGRVSVVVVDDRTRPLNVRTESTRDPDISETRLAAAFGINPDGSLSPAPPPLAGD